MRNGRQRRATLVPPWTDPAELFDVVPVDVNQPYDVRAGERIATIEAMKMEHPMLAPHDGVLSLAIGVGDQVRRHQIITHVCAEPGRETP